METESWAVRFRENQVGEMDVEPHTKKRKSTGHIVLEEKDAKGIVDEGKGGFTRYRAFDIAAAPPSTPSSLFPSTWSLDLTKNRSVGKLLWEKGEDVEGSVDKGKSGLTGYLGWDITKAPPPTPCFWGTNSSVEKHQLVLKEKVANVSVDEGKSGVITPHVEQCDDDHNDSCRRNFSKDLPPPIPSAGEAKIKFAEEWLAMYKRTAEMALEFYKKHHQCATDLEAVEILTGGTCYVGGQCEFVQFTVKPKTAAPDDDGCLVTINADLELGKFTRCNVVEGRDLEIYEGCPFYCRVDHPPEAFLPYVSIPFYIQQRMKQHIKDKVLPLKAISSAVRLAAQAE